MWRVRSCSDDTTHGWGWYAVGLYQCAHLHVASGFDLLQLIPDSFKLDQLPTTGIMRDGLARCTIWVRDFAYGLLRLGDCHRAVCAFSKVPHPVRYQHFQSNSNMFEVRFSVGKLWMFQYAKSVSNEHLTTDLGKTYVTIRELVQSTCYKPPLQVTVCRGIAVLNMGSNIPPSPLGDW